MTSDWKNHRRLPQSPATQLAMSIHRWVSASGDDDDDDEGALVGSRNIEKIARGECWSNLLNQIIVRETLTKDSVIKPTSFCLGR